MWTIARWAAGIAAGGALAAAVAAPAAAAAPGLVGQWRFDEPGGQVVADDGPQHLDGTLGMTGAPDAADPARIAGAAGGGLRFDGATFVRLPDSAALAVPTLTAEAVVRAGSSPGAYRYVVSRGGRSCVAGSYGLYSGAAGGVALYVFDGTRYVVSATRPAGGCVGRRLASRRRDLRRARAAALRGRPPGRRADVRAARDRLREHIRARLAGAVRRRLRPELPGRHGPRAALGRRAVRGGGRRPRPPPPWARPPGPGRCRRAAPGTTIAGTAAPAPAPGKRSSRRRCKVKLVGTRIRARRTVVRVGVTRGGRPCPPSGWSRVASADGGSRRRGRTRPGRASLAFGARRGRVRIAVPARPGCAAVGLPRRAS